MKNIWYNYYNLVFFSLKSKKKIMFIIQNNQSYKYYKNIKLCLD